LPAVAASDSDGFADKSSGCLTADYNGNVFEANGVSNGIYETSTPHAVIPVDDFVGIDDTVELAHGMSVTVLGSILSTDPNPAISVTPVNTDDSNYSLVVSDPNLNLCAYYIRLPEGCRIAPGTKLTITFNVGDEYNGRYVTINHKPKSGDLETFSDLLVQDGKVSIEVSSLSPFAVLLQPEVADGNPPSENPPVNDPSAGDLPAGDVPTHDAPTDNTAVGNTQTSNDVAGTNDAVLVGANGASPQTGDTLTLVLLMCAEGAFVLGAFAITYAVRKREKDKEGRYPCPKAH
jgi:hypothetical protein